MKKEMVEVDERRGDKEEDGGEVNRGKGRKKKVCSVSNLIPPLRSNNMPVILRLIRHGSTGTQQSHFLTHTGKHIHSNHRCVWAYQGAINKTHTHTLLHSRPFSISAESQNTI